MTLGERIAQLRKKHGWSQEDLGSRIGVSRQAVSRWESDQAVPETEKIIELSRLFEVSAGSLLGTEDIVKNTKSVQEPVRKKVWMPIAAGIAAAALLCTVIVNQNRQINELHDSLNGLQGMYGTLSYQMDQMRSDLTSILDEKLTDTVFAEYALKVDSIDREAGTYRVRLDGVLRSPSDTVRYFAKDSKDAIYNGEITVTDAQNGSVTGTIDVPLEEGMRFYAGTAEEASHLSTHGLDLYSFTVLNTGLSGYGYQDRSGNNKKQFYLEFTVFIPYVFDETDTPGKIQGTVQMIRDGKVIQECELTESTQDNVSHNQKFLETVFTRTEPMEDPEEYLIYADITDEYGRQFQGYVSLLHFEYKAVTGFFINIPVNPRTGEKIQ